MNFRRLLTVFAFIFVGLVSSLTLLSQEKEKVPEEQLGIGSELGMDNWIGFHGIYTLTPDMHFGAHVGFVFDGGTRTISSTTNLLFAPYFRYYLPKIAKSLKPFGEARLVINTGTRSVANPNDPNNAGSQSFTETAIKIIVGAQWFPYSSVGVYGGMNFLNLGLDPTRFKVGLGQAIIGVEWFLDR